MGAEGTREKATLIVRKHGLKNGTKIMLDKPTKATRCDTVRAGNLIDIGSGETVRDLDGNFIADGAESCRFATRPVLRTRPGHPPLSPDSQQRDARSPRRAIESHLHAP
jgi:hypothetical protein